MPVAAAILCAGFLSFVTAPVAAQQAEQQQVTLTVYSARPGEADSGFAWVEEERRIALAAGYNRVLWEPLPRSVDPNSVRLTVTKEAGELRTLAQTFLPGLAEGQPLLAALVGKPVRVEPRPARGRLFEGIVVQAAPQLAVRDAQGHVHIFPDLSRVEASAESLPTFRPAVAWEVEADRSGTFPVVARYEASAVGWFADYTVTLAPGPMENQGRLELAGAFLVENRTDLSWSEARLQLVAGEVRRPLPRARPQAQVWQREVMAMAKANDAARAQPVGEYYEYSLPRPVALPAGATLRLDALGVFRDVPYEQEFLCHNPVAEGFGSRGSPVTEREPGAGRTLPVEIFLRFANKKEAKLGIPLPSGVVRVGQRQGEGLGAWRFLGGGDLPHTAAGEEVVLPLGTAFDVVAERRQRDFLLQSEQRRMEEALAIELRNHKAKPVRVRVLETLYRAQQWEIVESTPKFAKKDARTIEFLVDVPAKGATSVSYRVKYTW